MITPASVCESFAASAVSHVVWVPDSFLGPWESALLSSSIKLVRPCREGEAIALAAGLLLGGARPLVVMQCTGLFEAGDALRNVVHDLRLPLKFLVGVRSQKAFLAGKSRDNCPTFVEPILRAWSLPFEWADQTSDESWQAGITSLMSDPAARALLIAE